MKEKKMIENKKGVTLIALVVTIIILLILAGVTVSILINKGLLNKTEIAVDEYKISEYKENIETIKTGEYIKKVSDKLPESLKELILNKLKSKENENWVLEVKTSEQDAELKESQIKLITKDKHIIVMEIEESGIITYIKIERDNGEPYPTITVEQIPLEGIENEKIKIRVNAEVEKTNKTKKISKIELKKDYEVIQTKNYNELKVENDIFEVEENGTYIIKVITDQGKSTSKKIVINIQGTENEINISAEPITARNTIKTETQNEIETGPIKVKIEYGETELQKQYKKNTDSDWTTVTDSITEIEVIDNVTIEARYYDGTNAFKLSKHSITNVDNVEPTINDDFDVVISGETITVNGTASDTASEGANEDIANGLKYEYKINEEKWQPSNMFIDLTAGEYTVYIKAIDKAGNEIIESKDVIIYTISYNANGGSETFDSQIGGTGTKIKLTTLEPTRIGYNFLGWSTNREATSAEYQSGEEYEIKNDETLYAVWDKNSYTVTLNDGDNIESVSGTGTYKYGETVTISAKVQTSTDEYSYSWAGWTGDTSYVSSPGSITTTVTIPAKNITLTANGTRILRSYTLSRSAGTGGSVSGDSGIKTNGTSCTVTATANTGYNFSGWYEGSTKVSSDASYTFTMPTKNYTLTAKFTEKTYTITYDENGGSGSMNSGTKSYGSSYTIASCGFTEPDGYTFKGWATSSSSHTIAYSSGSSYTSNENLILYAVWACDGTGYSCSGPFTKTTSHSTTYCSGGKPKTCYSTTSKQVVCGSWNDRSGDYIYSNCSNCGGVNTIKSKWWKCQTCGYDFKGVWACTSCGQGGVPRYSNHYKTEYTCSTHGYSGSSSSHTYTANCDHGYSSSHYYCSTHDWTGSTSSHSYTTSKSCKHGRYSTHSYCSHDETSTHYLN